LDLQPGHCMGEYDPESSDCRICCIKVRCKETMQSGIPDEDDEEVSTPLTHFMGTLAALMDLQPLQETDNSTKYSFTKNGDLLLEVMVARASGKVRVRIQEDEFDIGVLSSEDEAKETCAEVVQVLQQMTGVSLAYED